MAASDPVKLMGENGTQMLTSVDLDTTKPCTGQITVTTHGTAVRGPNVYNPGGFMLVAHPDNSDTAWFGNDGGADIANTNGWPLNAGGVPAWAAVKNLNQLWFDGDADGAKICWSKA